VKPISYKEKNPFRKIFIFKNTKYKWGGKSFKGIDCSALIQLFLNFNNRFCPRDAKDQVKYFKKNIKLKNIKKNDIIFWKGHVAIALSKKKLIHAYGPMKKTVVMDIAKTIKRIKNTAKLEVKGIKRV
jgi:cell wall-associated NlpC family hydrolase